MNIRYPLYEGVYRILTPVKRDLFPFYPCGNIFSRNPVSLERKRKERNTIKKKGELP